MPPGLRDSRGVTLFNERETRGKKLRANGLSDLRFLEVGFSAATRPVRAGNCYGFSFEGRSVERLYRAEALRLRLHDYKSIPERLMCPEVGDDFNGFDCPARFKGSFQFLLCEIGRQVSDMNIHLLLVCDGQDRSHPHKLSARARRSLSASLPGSPAPASAPSSAARSAAIPAAARPALGAGSCLIDVERTPLHFLSV